MTKRLPFCADDGLVPCRVVPPSYDLEGTVECETAVLLDLLGLVRIAVELRKDAAGRYRADDLRRRIMAGQVYVGVCDWPVEEPG